MYAFAISNSTTARSLKLTAETSLGAAVTRELLCCAMRKAASSSGTLPSVTRVWTSPTRLKENQPTRLAATVRATAPPSTT